MPNDISTVPPTPTMTVIGTIGPPASPARPLALSVESSMEKRVVALLAYIHRQGGGAPTNCDFEREARSTIAAVRSSTLREVREMVEGMENVNYGDRALKAAVLAGLAKMETP